MKFVVIFLSLLWLTKGSREHWLCSLSDEEYNILLNKVLNRFDTAVVDRSTVEKAVLRKYYRWVKAGRQLPVGPSGKNIYIDGKKVMRKSEIKQIVKKMEKNTKGSGSRKLAQRIKSRYIGCTERHVTTITANSLKV